MSTTEDRLIAALAARADQVQPEDLRAPEVPEAPPALAFLRRPAAYAVGIAAAAAAIAAPFVIGGLGSDDVPAPPTTQSPSPTLAPQPDIGGDWPVEERSEADLDGDGVPEQVRLRTEPGEPLIGPRLRVEADLSGGEPVFGILDSGEVSVNVVDPIQADPDAGEELVLNRDRADGLTSAWVVVDLVDGRLVEVEQAGDAPLSVNDVRDPDDADLAFQTDRWIDGGTLYSSRSVRSFPRYGMSFELPDPYVAEVWAWQLADGRLTPVAQDRLCISVREETREACAGDESEDIPGFFPEATEQIALGQSFHPGADGGGVDTIALEGTEDGEWSTDSELVVTLTGGEEQRLALPPGPPPSAYTVPAVPSDGASVVLVRPGADSSTFTYVVSWKGGLVEVPPEGDVPFGSGFLEDDRGYSTWLSEDGRLFTRVSTDGSDTAYVVHTWSMVVDGPDADPTLRSVELGTFCFDFIPSPAEVTRCE